MRGVPVKPFPPRPDLSSWCESDRSTGLEDLEALIGQLPSLGGGEPRSSEHTGVKALMLAVLEDGIVSFLARRGAQRAEAETWIMGDSRRSPFAFPVVCETLGLEPDAVRLALRQMRLQHLSERRPIARARPNVRRAARAACASSQRSS